MARRATGPFEVKLNPQPAYNTDETALLGRMSIDKHFHGDLEGTSKGEMLTAGSAVKGSAGELEGLTGTMSIEIVNGKHSYVLDYAMQGGR
jgi:hypothetical protein